MRASSRSYACFAAPAPPPRDPRDSRDPLDDLLSVEQKFTIESVRRELPTLSREVLERRLLDLLGLMMRRESMMRKLGIRPSDD